MTLRLYASKYKRLQHKYGTGIHEPRTHCDVNKREAIVITSKHAEWITAGEVYGKQAKLRTLKKVKYLLLFSDGRHGNTAVWKFYLEFMTAVTYLLSQIIITYAVVLLYALFIAHIFKQKELFTTTIVPIRWTLARLRLYYYNLFYSQFLCSVLYFGRIQLISNRKQKDKKM